MTDDVAVSSPRAGLRRLVVYVVSILLAELVGVVGSLATAPAVPGWYATIPKPAWTPPGWLFAPVWTALYAAMGVAAARVFIRHHRTSAGRASLGLYLAHLVVNGAWSFLFFGLRSPGAGLVDIVVLWIMIVALIGWWWRLERPAAWLLTPYLAWVSFATALNAAMWRLS